MDVIDSEVKNLLSSLIISSSSGLTLRRLRNDYREFTGDDVPFRRFGFPTFEAYIRTIPDTCRLNGIGDHALVEPVINENNKHINDMILKQKQPKTKYRKPKRASGVFISSNTSTPNTSSVPESPTLPNELPSLISLVEPNSHLRTLPPPHDYVSGRTNLKCKKLPKPITFNKSSIYQSYVNSTNSQTNNVTNNTYTTSQETSIFSQQECDNNLSIEPVQNINKNQTCTNYDSYSENHNVNCDSNDYSYDNNENCDVNYDQDNYKTESLCYNSSYKKYNGDYDFDDEDCDFNYIEEDFNEEDDFDCMSRADAEVEKKENLNCQQEDNESHTSRIDDEVKENLRMLIAENPNGIWCSKLLNLYREKFNKELDPVDYGFYSVIQFCSDIPDVFQCTRPTRTDWKLYDCRKPIPNDFNFQELTRNVTPANNNTTNKSEPAIPPNMPQFRPRPKYPDEVMHPGEKLDKFFDVPNNPEEYIEIIVSQIYDPSKFWVQLKPQCDELNLLMDEMQVFYLQKQDEYKLTNTLAQEGLYVAAMYGTDYHRAKIVKIFPDSTLTVYYVDYGTVDDVKIDKVCLLHRKFTDIPEQAIRCRLDNIRPKEQNTMWSPASCLFLYNVTVGDKLLLATIQEIDFENKTIYTIITDTTGESDVHLNDALVERGFADFGNFAEMCETSDALIDSIHLYPTFDELENYKYPHVKDRDRLLKIGKPLSIIFEGYFRMPNNQDPFVLADAVKIARKKKPPPFDCNNDAELDFFVNDDGELVNSVKLEDVSNEDVSNEDEITVNEMLNGDVVNHTVKDEDDDNDDYENDIKEEIEIDDVLLESEDIKLEEDPLLTPPIPLEEEVNSPEQKSTVTRPPPGFDNVTPDVNNFILQASEIQQQLCQFQLLQQQQQQPPPPQPPMPPTSSSLTLNGSNSTMLIDMLRTLSLNQQQQIALAQIIDQSVIHAQQQTMIPLMQQTQVNYFTQHTTTSQSQGNFPSSGNNMVPTFQNPASMNTARNLTLPSNFSNPFGENMNLFNRGPINYSDIVNNSQSRNPPATTELNPLAPTFVSKGKKLEQTTSESESVAVKNSVAPDFNKPITKLMFSSHVLHILKLDDKYYVVSKELMSNVLFNSFKYTTQFATKDVDFAQKLINLRQYKGVYDEFYKFPIVGGKISVDGNINVTPFNKLEEIIHAFADKQTIIAFEDCIKQANMESKNLHRYD